MLNKKMDLLIQDIIKYGEKSIKYSLPVFTYEPQLKVYSGDMKKNISEKTDEEKSNINSFL